MIVIEDDNHAALLENGCPPITLLVPENCIYLSGLSKPLSPGLRIAYMLIPPRFVKELEHGLFSQNLKIIREKRELSIHRNRIYRTYFPDAHFSGESYYQWLELPDGLSGQMCEAKLARQGISVFGAERFSVSSQAKHNAVRIATCSPGNDEQLRQGLDAVHAFVTRRRS